MMEKLKRGRELLVIETGATVYFYREREDGMIIVSNDKNFTDVFEAELSDLKQSKQKQVSSIQSKHKVLTDGQKDCKKSMQHFFNSLTIPTHCENCGDKIWGVNSFSRRCLSAHIIPKSKFKSVSTNKLNIMFLGAGVLFGGCRCHDEWDSLDADKRKKMPVYKLAIERFLQFKDELSDKELIKACEYLGIDYLQFY